MVMNLQKFTQKSLEAIQNAQSMAVEYGKPQMDQQHLLVTLLTRTYFHGNGKQP